MRYLRDVQGKTYSKKNSNTGEFALTGLFREEGRSCSSNSVRSLCFPTQPFGYISLYQISDFFLNLEGKKSL